MKRNAVMAAVTIGILTIPIARFFGAGMLLCVVTLVLGIRCMRPVLSTNSAAVAVKIGILTTIIPTFFLFMSGTFLFAVPCVLGILCILLGALAGRTESRFSRHVDKIAFVIMLIAVGLPFGMIAYHNRSGSPIVFVVPDGFRGPIKMVIDRQHGLDVPLQDGRYTYYIPASGTLTIKDAGPFRHRHSLRAVYAGGNPIPIDYENDERSLPPDAIMLHSLGSGVKMEQGKANEEFLEDFVGTKAELRDLYCAPRTGPPEGDS